MTKRKPFKELDLSNAFLFAAALQDEETCQLVLEMILGIPIGKVRVKAEHSILYSSDFRSIRLDIYASSEAGVQYDVEMQNERETYLSERSRYYQAVMDMSSLQPGQDYRHLKPSYIIFICTFDPYGEQLYRYTFEERCLETNQPMGDGTRKIFLSTKGKNTKDVPVALTHFLHYVEYSTETYVEQSQDEFLRKLHEKVKQLKKDHDLEEHYMKFEELLDRREEKGKEEGIKEGKTRMLKELIQSKLAKGKNLATISEELEVEITVLEGLITQMNQNS